jgi:hypothetical protein
MWLGETCELVSFIMVWLKKNNVLIEHEIFR